MKTMRSRLTGILLVLLLLVGMLPAGLISLTASAASGDGSQKSPYLVSDSSELSKALMKGGYVKLSNDIDVVLSGTQQLYVQPKRAVFLDLAGKKLNINATGSTIKSAFKLTENSELRISDSNKSGGILSILTTTAGRLFSGEKDSLLELASGTYRMSFSNGATGGEFIYSKGKVIIGDAFLPYTSLNTVTGMIVAGELIFNGGTHGDLHVSFSKLTIYDGIFDGLLYNEVDASNAVCLEITGSMQIAISGGVFKHSLFIYYWACNTDDFPAISISGGTFTDLSISTTNKARVPITGGSFKRLSRVYGVATSTRELGLISPTSLCVLDDAYCALSALPTVLNDWGNGFFQGYIIRVVMTSYLKVFPIEECAEMKNAYIDSASQDISEEASSIALAAGNHEFGFNYYSLPSAIAAAGFNLKASIKTDGGAEQSGKSATINLGSGSHTVVLLLTLCDKDGKTVYQSSHTFNITATSGALTAISSLSATVSGLEHFAFLIDAEVSSGDSAKYSTSVNIVSLTWAGDATIFDPCETVRIIVSFTPKAGYKIDSTSIPVKINGKTATYYETSYGVYKYYIDYYFPIYILRDIEFDFASPAVSQYPVSTVQIANSGDLPYANYTLDNIYWADQGTDGNDWIELDGTEAFEAGHYYYCQVYIDLINTDDYEYCYPVSGFTAVINGKTYNGYSPELEINASTGTLTATFSYHISSSETANVSGTVKSYGSSESDQTALALYAVSGGAAAAAPSYETLVTGTGKKAFGFPGVADGTYILRVTKKNHTSREYTVKVSGGSAKLDAEICLTGDVNGNGKIDSTDYIMVKRTVLGSYTPADYPRACADINGDSKVNSTDYIMLKRAVLGTYEIFE